VKSKKECLPSFVFALFFDFQERVSCKSKTLRKDATDAQMKMQAEPSRVSAQRAQDTLCL
jgi:hypothetical protein